jgi:hypothetical protein
MAISPEEIELANKYISDYEKTISMQRWSIWLVLLLAVALLATVPYLFTQVERVQEKNSHEYILGDKEVTPKILGKYIDARIELVRIETALSLKMVFPTLFGGVLLGLAISFWATRKRKTIIVKVLRHILGDIQQKDKGN